MRRNVFIFLSATLLSLMAVPFFNILSAKDLNAIKWTEKSFLYNMDFASRWAARFLYPLGISTDPKQVIIGRDGWIYLGDRYEQTRTVDRRPASEKDTVLGEKIGRAANAWGAYLSSKGVKLFRVMLAPNKGTIYPENLPEWAKPSPSNATDALISGTGSAQYVDLRKPLLAAKANHSEGLYYKTDTHWNSLGAGIAFREFAQHVAPAAKEIHWPSPEVYELHRIDLRKGGDLAGFLRLTTHLSDHEPITNVASLPIETKQSDFDTKKILHQGSNQAVGSPQRPLLVQSVGALNHKKVLWLRDSFGTALSPFMAATFSEVLQLHWGEAIKPDGRFLQLIEEWKPDYVFFTVVERASRSPWFAAYPPPAIVPRKSKFKPIQTSRIVATNNLSSGTTDSEFKITGIDPFIDFALPNTKNSAEAHFLNIDLTCADGSLSVPLKLFWLESGRQHFDKEHSVRLLMRTGHNLIDVRTISKWDSATSIKRIRIDIDAPRTCLSFKLKNPSLGLNIVRSG